MRDVLKTQYYGNSANKNSSQQLSPQIQLFPKEKMAKNQRLNREAEKIKEQENEKKSIQENFIKDLKNFRNRFEVTVLTQKELLFMENVKRNEYNTVKFALIASPNLVEIKDKVILFLKFCNFY